MPMLCRTRRPQGGRAGPIVDIDAYILVCDSELFSVQEQEEEQLPIDAYGSMTRYPLYRDIAYTSFWKNANK